jgi:hypothetical protein
VVYRPPFRIHQRYISTYTLLIDLIALGLGYQVYGRKDVEVDVQIANYAMLNKGDYIVVGTDYDFFGLMDGIKRVLNPTESTGWYLDVEKFRRVLGDEVNRELTNRDIFVVCCLAQNDNIKTHIRRVGFKTALRELGEWRGEHSPTSIAAYRGFVHSLSKNKETTDSILQEMDQLWFTNGLYKPRPETLQIPTCIDGFQIESGYGYLFCL